MRSCWCSRYSWTIVNYTVNDIKETGNERQPTGPILVLGVVTSQLPACVTMEVSEVKLTEIDRSVARNIETVGTDCFVQLCNDDKRVTSGAYLKMTAQ